MIAACVVDDDDIATRALSIVNSRQQSAAIAGHRESSACSAIINRPRTRSQLPLCANLNRKPFIILVAVLLVVCVRITTCTNLLDRISIVPVVSNVTTLFKPPLTAALLLHHCC